VGETGSVLPDVPLTTLLSWTWIAQTIEIDNALEQAASDRVGRHFRISLPMWTNGLRFIDDGGISVDALRRRTRAACNLGGLERWGWITVGDDTGTRRDGFGSGRGLKSDAIVRPTRAGRYARRRWPEMVDTVEARWRTRFGGDVIDRLRQALLDRDAEGLPWSPPEVHPSDGFRTHVFAGDDADAERPLVALLGQALTRLTLDHELEAEVSLPLAANALRAIGGEAVRTRDLPRLTGLSKEGTAMSVSCLRRHDLAGSSIPGPAVRLTPRGLDALDAYRVRSARPQDDPRRGALEAVLTEREQLAAGLVPPAGGWRPRSRTWPRRRGCSPSRRLPYRGTRWSCTEVPGPTPARPGQLHHEGSSGRSPRRRPARR
jgi:hypothetical protein